MPEEVDGDNKKPLLDSVISYLNELGPRSGSDNYPTISIGQYIAPKNKDEIVIIMDLVATYKNGKQYNIIRLTNDVAKEDTYEIEKNFYDTVLRVLLFQKDEVKLSEVLTGNIDGIKEEIQDTTASN